MPALGRERRPCIESVDDPWFGSEILLATRDGFELPSQTQQCLQKLGLMRVIVRPIGCEYRTWCDATLRVSRQEDKDIELLRGQSQSLALQSGRAFGRIDNKIADFDPCRRGGSVNVCRFCRTLREHSSQRPDSSHTAPPESGLFSFDQDSATPLGFPRLGKISP